MYTARTEITLTQYEQLEALLPRQRGNVSLNRWAKNGVLDQMFSELQRQQIIRVRVEAVSLDSTAVKVNHDSTGAKKTAHKPSSNPEQDGQPRFIWLRQMLAGR
jgi:hypothetical protein